MGSSKKAIIGYRYYAGLMLALTHGKKPQRKIKLRTIKVGETVAWSGSQEGSGTINIDKPDLFGGDKREGGIVAAVDVCMGEDTQDVNPYLLSKLPGLVPAYRGIVALIVRGRDIPRPVAGVPQPLFPYANAGGGALLSSNNAYIKPWYIEMQANFDAWYPEKAVIGDGHVNAAHIIYECLTDATWGLGYNITELNDAEFRAAADALYSEVFPLSLLWDDQSSLEDFIQLVCQHVDGLVYVDPRTGLWTFKLARLDYDINTIPSIDESEILELESFQQALLSTELINQVNLVYIDADTGKEATVSAHDIALIDMSGAVSAETVQLYGIPTNELASRIVVRELRKRSSPLARLTFVGNRKVSSFTINTVFKFSWPAYGISNLVMRVANISYGTFDQSEVRVDAVQDVFANKPAIYSTPQPSGWVPVKSGPQPLPNRVVGEAPRYEILRQLGAADTAALDPSVGFIMATGSRPTGDAYSARLNTDLNGGAVEYIFQDDAPLCPTATLAVGVNEIATTFTLNNIQDIGNADVNSWAVLGTEILRIDSILDNTITVGRGVLDTVAVSHTLGSRLYFVEDFLGFDQTQYAESQSVNVKMQTVTSGGTLALADAPTDNVAITARANRPYPPGRVRIGGVAYPSNVTGPVNITWNHRNRLQQNLEGDESGNIGPESGVTYTARIYNNDTSTLITTQTGITGTTCNIAVGGTFNMRIELESVRIGVTSYQKHSLVFAYSFVGGHILAESGDVLVSEVADQLITE